MSENVKMVFFFVTHDAFISAVIFGKKEIEEGPLSESPIYKVCKREGVSL
jgi:hypothetical protein